MQPGYFEAEEVCWNRVTPINVSYTAHEKEALQGKILMFFFHDALTTAFSMRVELRDEQKQGTFFQNQGIVSIFTFFYFQKRLGEVYPLPPLVTCQYFSIELHKKKTAENSIWSEIKHFLVKFRPIVKTFKNE